jgi:hypothetical protein
VRQLQYWQGRDNLIKDIADEWTVDDAEAYPPTSPY